MLKCHLFRKDFPKYSVGNIPCPGGRNSLPVLSLLYFCPEPASLPGLALAGRSLSVSPLDRQLSEFRDLCLEHHRCSMCWTNE